MWCLVQVDAGFTPSKETLKKVRRRCSRESDFDSDEKVQSLAKQFNYRMGGENRREMLFNIEYSAEFASTPVQGTGLTFSESNIFFIFHRIPAMALFFFLLYLMHLLTDLLDGFVLQVDFDDAGAL